MDNSNERQFSAIRLCSRMAPAEIEDYFRRKELHGEKGWKLVKTECVFYKKIENYKCNNMDYYLISATFVQEFQP